MAMVSNHFAQELIWRCFVRTRTQVRKNESLAVAGMLTRRIQIPWASPKRHKIKKNSNNARHLSSLSRVASTYATKPKSRGQRNKESWSKQSIQVVVPIKRRRSEGPGRRQVAPEETPDGAMSSGRAAARADNHRPSPSPSRNSTSSHQGDRK